MERKVVLITGASTGFGRASAELLAQQGYRVFATMRDTAGRNAQPRQELESRGLDVLELDVTDESSVAAAVSESLSRAGHIDAVINNAGFGNLGVTEAYTVEQFKQVYDTNIFGAVRVNRAVLPSMRKRGAGLLIHVSSIAGRVTLPYMALYSSSKFALESIADAYRSELAPFGIDSVVVEPGAFATPIFQKPFFAEERTREQEYGDRDYSRRIHQTFEAELSDPNLLPVSEVAGVFLRLIETPAGERPFRTHIGGATEFLGPYNQLAEQIRQGTAEHFNIRETLTLNGR